MRDPEYEGKAIQQIYTVYTKINLYILEWRNRRCDSNSILEKKEQSSGELDSYQGVKTRYLDDSIIRKVEFFQCFQIIESFNNCDSIPLQTQNSKMLKPNQILQKNPRHISRVSKNMK